MPIHSSKKLLHFPHCLAENVKSASTKRINKNTCVTGIKDSFRQNISNQTDCNYKKSNDGKSRNEKISAIYKKSYLKSFDDINCPREVPIKCNSKNAHVSSNCVKKVISNSNPKRYSRIPFPNKKTHIQKKEVELTDAESLRIDIPVDINDDISPILKKITPRLKTSKFEPICSVSSARSTYRSAISLDIVDLWDSDNEIEDTNYMKFNQSFDFADLINSDDFDEKTNFPNLTKKDNNFFSFKTPQKELPLLRKTYVISRIKDNKDIINKKDYHSNVSRPLDHETLCKISNSDELIDLEECLFSESDSELDLLISSDSQIKNCKLEKNVDMIKSNIPTLKRQSSDDSLDDDLDIIIGNNSKFHTRRKSNFSEQSYDSDSAIGTGCSNTNDSDFLRNHLKGLSIIDESVRDEQNENKKVTFDNFVAIDDGNEKSFDVLKSTNNNKTSFADKLLKKMFKFS